MYTDHEYLMNVDIQVLFALLITSLVLHMVLITALVQTIADPKNPDR